MIGNMKEIYLDDLKEEFKKYFLDKKPNYKKPGPLFGMAFYITRNNLGVTLEDVFSGRVSLDEYGNILYSKFAEMDSKNPYGRMSAYKDAMKNLLEFVHDAGYEQIKVIDLPKVAEYSSKNYIADEDKSMKKQRSSKVFENNLPKPSIEQVKYWLAKWDELEDYVAQEAAIDKLFYGEFKSNDNLQNILIKCSVLNDFYSTNIFKIYPVAKHILSLNVDKRLEDNDVTLVDDIAKVIIGDSEKNFYSFASKYCSHHKALEYPIYDSYVEKVLLHFNKVYHFYTFTKTDLKEYSKFKTILIKFREFFKLEEFNLKELDKYLWQFGKYYFPKTYY